MGTGVEDKDVVCPPNGCRWVTVQLIGQPAEPPEYGTFCYLCGAEDG